MAGQVVDPPVVEDVEADRRRLRAVLIAKVHTMYELRRRRRPRLVRYAHVGRPW